MSSPQWSNIETERHTHGKIAIVFRDKVERGGKKETWIFRSTWPTEKKVMADESEM